MARSRIHESQVTDVDFLSEDEHGSIDHSTVSGVPRTFLELTDTPVDYDDGKFIRSTASGTEWAVGVGISDHASLDNLGYASAGHTGFQPSGDYVTETEFTTYSGSIIDQIPTDFYTTGEVDTISGTIFGQIITDHGGLAGLSDDDHTQYVLVNGSRAITSKVSYASHPTFTADTNIVDKKYVDDQQFTLSEDLTPELGGNLNTGNYDISGTGTIITGDHGTATTAEVVNTIYGTGDPPTASNYPIGTVYIKYTA